MRWRAVLLAALFSAPTEAQPSFRDCAECPPMIALPAGSFTMGSSEEERARVGIPDALGRREAPAHRVVLSHGFAIGMTEVTRAQYARFAVATGRRDAEKGCSVLDRPHDSWVYDRRATWRTPGESVSDTSPVSCVNWFDATAYAAWLTAQTGKTYRLPSEAEWEYAARGGTQTAAPWGNALDGGCARSQIMNAASDAAMGHLPSWQGHLVCTGGMAWTVPVASFPPNAFGLYDMIGNVWEWTADCAHADYEGAPQDGSAWIAPACPERSIRGGAFHSAFWFARSAARGYGKAPDHASIAIGFRIARDLDQ